MRRLEQIIERVREKGYRLTPQRQAIIKILLESSSHPTAEQVYAQVKPIFPMTSLATVYKTISMLKEMGEVIEINLGETGARYDGRNLTPHAHIICVQCNQINDADLVDLYRFSENLSTLSGYQIINQRLDFFGICPACQINSTPQV